MAAKTVRSEYRQLNLFEAIPLLDQQNHSIRSPPNWWEFDASFNVESLISASKLIFGEPLA